MDPNQTKQPYPHPYPYPCPHRYPIPLPLPLPLTQVYYIDDRMDLLEYVGPHIGVTGNAKLNKKLGSKAKAYKFCTVRVGVRKG